MVNNHEVRNNTENSTESDWDDLEQLANEGAFEAQKSAETAKDELSDTDHEDRIADAAAKVRETYQKMEQPTDIDPTFAPDYDFGSTATSPKKESKFATRTADRYAIKERARIDRLKTEISDSWDVSEYENRQIKDEPSTRQKFRRLLMDRLGIRTKKSEDLREREAMAVALRELSDERAAKEQADAEQAAAEVAQREAEKAAEAERKERESLERDMSDARREIERRQDTKIKNERAQEYLERDLNERLLSPDKLEEAVLMETPGVSKRSEKYNDQEIPVYDLKGLPFSILSHTVDYRKKNRPGEIGTETYKKVMEDPSIWAQRREQAEQASGYGTRDGNARGDTISASYYTSEKNLDSYVSGDLMYGFAGVSGDSVISVSNGDGGTSNTGGRDETKISQGNEITTLEGAGSTASYNEVLLRRYDADGRAKRPDFIVTENGQISEAAKRHAAYFGIPIVNIERSVYEKNAESRGVELLNSISENDSYEEIDEKIDELKSMSRYKGSFHMIKSIGRAIDAERGIINTELDRKMQDIAELELAKRLDFVMDALEKATEEIEAATEAGVRAPAHIPGIESMSIIINDVQNGTEITENNSVAKRALQAPGACNDISLDFKLSGSTHYVSTRIFDGAHPYKPEEARNLSQEDIDKADSSYFAAFEPVIMKYFEAARENRDMLRKAA